MSQSYWIAPAHGQRAANGQKSTFYETVKLLKVYPTGTEALTNVSFTVNTPQVVTIIGPSGAGKSTLIRCINRLVKPTSGRVFWEGKDVVALSRIELRKVCRRIGMIFKELIW